MDIELLLKKANPTWSDAMITARRIEGFKKIYGHQVNYWNWKNGTYSISHKNLIKVCKEFNLNIKDIPLGAVVGQSERLVCDCPDEKLWDIKGKIVCECGKYHERKAN